MVLDPSYLLSLHRVPASQAARIHPTPIPHFFPYPQVHLHRSAVSSPYAIFLFLFFCLEREFSCLKIVASIGIMGRGPRATCFMQPALPFSSGDILITSTVSLLRYMARMCVSKTTPSGDFHVFLGRLGENGLKIYCDNSSSTIFKHNSPSRKSNALLRFLDSLLANHQYFGGEGGGAASRERKWKQWPYKGKSRQASLAPTSQTQYPYNGDCHHTNIVLTSQYPYDGKSHHNNLVLTS